MQNSSRIKKNKNLNVQVHGKIERAKLKHVMDKVMGKEERSKKGEERMSKNDVR